MTSTIKSDYTLTWGDYFFLDSKSYDIKKKVKEFTKTNGIHKGIKTDYKRLNLTMRDPFILDKQSCDAKAHIISIRDSYLTIDKNLRKHRIPEFHKDISRIIAEVKACKDEVFVSISLESIKSLYNDFVDVRWRDSYSNQERKKSLIDGSTFTEGVSSSEEYKEPDISGHVAFGPYGGISHLFHFHFDPKQTFDQMQKDDWNPKDCNPNSHQEQQEMGPKSEPEREGAAPSSEYACGGSFGDSDIPCGGSFSDADFSGWWS